MKQGYVHSIETFGTKDGPGIRFIVFMQGCPLRCMYCHNPDTWHQNNAKFIRTPEDIFEEFDKVRTFVRGGITVSGGEPFIQAEFVRDLLRLFKTKGIHTAVDTSGRLLSDTVKEALEYTDLVLLDIKHIDPDKYRMLTGQPLEHTLKFMEYLLSISKPVWLRYVLVSGYTDDDADLRKWAEYASRFDNVERVDILPFHQMATGKWDELGYDYRLRGVEPPTAEQKKHASDIFKSYGLKVE